MPRGYRFLEHMSDVYVEAYGDSLEEAFAQAGLALFRTIIPEAEGSDRSVEVEAEGDDLHQLLYNWLEKLLLVFEMEQLVGTDVVVEAIERAGGGYRVRGRVIGVDYDPAKHKTGTAVKSPTYWRMEIQQGGTGAVLRYVLDI